MEDRVGGGDAVRRRLEREVIDRRLDRVAPRLAWDLYYYKSELLRAPLLPPQFFSREVYQIADDHSFPKYYRTTTLGLNSPRDLFFGHPEGFVARYERAIALPHAL